MLCPPLYIYLSHFLENKLIVLFIFVEVFVYIKVTFSKDSNLYIIINTHHIFDSCEQVTRLYLLLVLFVIMINLGYHHINSAEALSAANVDIVSLISLSRRK